MEIVYFLILEIYKGSKRQKRKVQKDIGLYPSGSKDKREGISKAKKDKREGSKGNRRFPLFWIT